MAGILVLIQPSSAAIERVFSQLRLAIGDTQQQLLADAVEAVVMLRYNDRDGSGGEVTLL